MWGFKNIASKYSTVHKNREKVTDPISILNGQFQQNSRKTRHDSL